MEGSPRLSQGGICAALRVFLPLLASIMYKHNDPSPYAKALQISATITCSGT